MSCKPCDDKKPKPEEKVEAIPTSMLAITCYCGLTRLLPPGLSVGDTVTLKPCIKCGSKFIGRMVEGGVQT